MIYKCEKYIKNVVVDGQVRQMEIEVQSGGDDVVIYVAHFVMATPQGTRLMQAPIDAETLEDAFDKFEETASSAVKEAMTTPRIVTPGG